MNGYGPRYNTYADGHHIRPGHRVVVKRDDGFESEPEAGTVIRTSRAEASEGYTVLVVLDDFPAGAMWFRPDEIQREGEES